MNLIKQYKIKHRLPGRIRLHIPALEKLPSDWHPLAEPVNELITLKNGIHSAKIEPVSGGVILSYIPETICERDVLNWLELVARRFIDSVRCHKNPTKKDCLSVLHLLRKRLRATVMNDEI